MLSDLTKDESEALKNYILSKFKGAFDFNSWLVVNIWPAFREKMDQNAAAKRKADRLARKAAKDTSPISTRFKALDGAQLTEAQVWKAAKTGDHVLDLATGQPRRFLWRIKGKVGRWVPLDCKDAW